MNQTFEDMVNDLERLTHNDKELNQATDILYGLYRKKGLPYRELFRSKLFGTVRYIVTDDGTGNLSITNLDTNEEVRKDSI